MNSLGIAKIDATWLPPRPLLPLLVFDDLRWPLLRQLAASVDGQKQGEGEGGGGMGGTSRRFLQSTENSIKNPKPAKIAHNSVLF